MKILYLYSELCGYNISTMKALTKKGAKVTVVHWDHKKLGEYNYRGNDEINEYKRSKLNRKDILELAKKINPNITVISGWQDKGYLYTAKYLKSNKKIVVCALDTNWENSIKNYVMKLLTKLNITSIFYSHYWIPGYPQYEFLKKLSIDDSKIIFNALSADLTIFESSFHRYKDEKERHYPHRFLYVGRLSWQKSIPLLISAWKDIQEKNTDWELVLIGNGNLKDSAEGYKNIKILNWLQPEDLHEEIKKSGCFIVPSHWEPWAVTVHEFCAAGMPMILSDKIGARTTFLIDNHNGYTFESKNLESLKNALLKVINDSDKNLFQMGKHSHEISKKITPEISAASLLSCIKN